MAKNNNLTDFLTDVANAIRAKKGTTAKINPQDFSSEIASISTGGGSDIPVIGDGKTYLYIKIAEKGRMTVPLYFSQTAANGVTIDWGDGSATQTLSGTGNLNTTHTYASIGDYVITLKVNSGTLGLGNGSSSYCVMGSIEPAGRVYCNMLQKVEIGRSVTSIGSYAFYYCNSLASVVISRSVTSIGRCAFENCFSLASIVIPRSVTSIAGRAFYNCYSLTSVVIPSSVTSIAGRAFYYCNALTSVVIPSSVTSIESYAFGYCYGMAFYDFRTAKAVPTLSNTNAFNSIPSDCKIVVPDSLYSSWTTATNWSTYASKIVKASEFNG